jgi:hypothetical protein
MRSREIPNAPVEVGHRTITVCHLVNITRELDRPLRWDPAKEQFLDDVAANELLDRPRRKGFELSQLKLQEKTESPNQGVGDSSTSALPTRHRRRV